jgi:hypothetical protein
MLRVNVGLSRKLTRDFNSTGYSVNIEGEVCVPLDEPQRVIDKIRELHDLADESLRDQIERYESESAVAARDAAPLASPPAQRAQPVNRIINTPAADSTPATPPAEQATNKQVQFLLSLGKRNELSKPQLEGRIAEILGRAVGIYDLTKKEAGVVLDRLTAETSAKA